jgi:hypothetical protein
MQPRAAAGKNPSFVEHDDPVSGDDPEEFRLFCTRTASDARSH